MFGGSGFGWGFGVRLLAGCILGVACGCSPGGSEAPADSEPEAAAPEPEAPPEQPAGHRRMVELLREIAERAETENPYLGQGPATKIRDDLAALPADAIVPKRWLLNVLMGKHELRLGNEERSLDYYHEAHRLLGESRDPVPRDAFLRTIYELGVAYMRFAETRNCVHRHTSESCIFPIRGAGVHADREGSEAAVGYFNQVLEHADPGSDEYLRARWLLNVAQMTLGRYPGEPPEPFRIEPEVFDSDEPFPRFEEIAPRLGLNSFDLAGGAIADDFTGDGLLDIMVSTSHTSGQLRFYVNDGKEGFTERTTSAGLDGLVGGLNLVQADYDNDGDVDVLVLRGGWWRRVGRHPNSLLRNNGNGTFTDVTFEAGLGEAHYPTQTAGWADYDLDGDLDLYVGNESGKSVRFDETEVDDASAPGQLFRNDGDGTFTDVAAEAGVENLKYAKGVIWGDYDNDRYPDLYVSNGGGANRLYHNNGDGTFTDVAKESGVIRPYGSFAVWFWDVQNDGALDLFVAAYGGPRLPADVKSVAAGYLGLPNPGGELARLYLGDGRGGFREVGREWGLGRTTLPMGSNFGDLDNDGFPDFYLGTGYPYYEGLMPNVMYRNRRGQGFADVTTAGGFGHLQKGHGVVFADLDHDGDQDVLEQIGGAYPGDAYGNVLFENPGFGNHWIKVKLVGRETNRLAVGARLRIDIEEDGERRSIHGRVSSGGSFGANPLRREIGLGRAETIDLLEIYWPVSDTTQRFRNVAVDQSIQITEGGVSYQRLAHEPIPFGG